MEMTEAFGTTVAVTIPILALAASTEARTIRERLKAPDEKWEAQFAGHRSEHDLNLSGPGAGADTVAFFREMPKIPAVFLVERILAIIGAVVWLVTFVLLTIAELSILDWLADGEPKGDSGLAGFAVFSIGLTMVVLIAAPTLYLLVPLVVPLDMIPDGLRKTLVPKLADERSRGVLKELLRDFEGSIERAAERAEAREKEDAEATGTDPQAPDEAAADASPAKKRKERRGIISVQFKSQVPLNDDES